MNGKQSGKFSRRKLKVHYGQYEGDSVQFPVIRIGGKYLKTFFNFQVGDDIEVTIHAGEIRIRRVEEQNSA